jgi:sortase A
MAAKQKLLTIRRFNNLLSIIVVALGLYLLIAPFWPQASYEFKDEPPLVKNNDKNAGNDVAIPQENTLVIPKMKLQEIIHESQDMSALRKGVWHRPHSSSPDHGGNTVLTGHRFTYGGPAVLYMLDVVQPGDEITIYWNRQRYDYRVEHVSVVPPDSKDVEKETTEPLLTIYTCTPLFTARNRLVVQAKLVEESVE